MAEAGGETEHVDRLVRQRRIFFAVSALVVVGVAWAARAAMLPLVLGSVIAYVLFPLVRRVERRGVPRAVAVLVVYVIVLGGIAGAVRLIAPRIGQEVKSLIRETPRLLADVEHTWVPVIESRVRAVFPRGASEDAAPEQPAVIVKPQPDGTAFVELGDGILVRRAGEGYIIEQPHPGAERLDLHELIDDSIQASITYVQRNAIEVLRLGGGLVVGVARFFFVFGLTLMVAAYLMLTAERIERFFVGLARPPDRGSFRELIARIDRGLSGVVRGQLIICLVNGALSAVGFALVGLKYWPVMAVLATVLSLIPIFGAIISSVPAVLLGLTQSFGTAVFVLAWIIGIHQLEANVLNPKIMGHSAKLHPVLVIFSLLVGEHLFHVTGALLAVPCMSVAQSVFLHVRERLRQADPENFPHADPEPARPAEGAHP